MKLFYLIISDIKNLNKEDIFNTKNIEEATYALITSNKDIIKFPKQRSNIKCVDYIKDRHIKYSYTNEYTGLSEIIICIPEKTYNELLIKAYVGWDF